jgi:hypothetical protein
LCALEQPLAELREFSDQHFGFLTGQRGGVNFDGQLLEDGLVGVAGKAKPPGATGKFKQFCAAAAKAALKFRALLTAFRSA